MAIPVLQAADVRWISGFYPTADAIADPPHDPPFLRLVNGGWLRYRSGYQLGYVAMGELYHVLFSRDLSKTLGTPIVAMSGGAFRG